MKTVFTKADWEQAFKPCVYRFLDSDGNPLYIGYSQYGYNRIFEHGRKPIDRYQINRLKAKELMNSLEIEFFETDADARTAEAQLIHELHPKYNRCHACWKVSGEKLHDARIKENVRKFHARQRVPAPNSYTSYKPS